MNVITKLVPCTCAQMQQIIWCDIVPLGLTGLFFVSCTASLAGELTLGDLEALSLPSAATLPIPALCNSFLAFLPNPSNSLKSAVFEIETLQSCS